jgi:hypothetical protein
MFAQLALSSLSTHRNGALALQLRRTRGCEKADARDRMVGVGMSLQAVADLVQRTRMHLSRHHYVRTKINEQVRVDQHSRAFAQTRPSGYPCLRAVLTFARRL